MTRALPLVVALAVAVAGCGVEMPDVLELRRSGSLPGAGLELVVNDSGTVRCNRGPPRQLPSALLVDARGLKRDTEEDALRNRVFPRRPGSLLAYDVRYEEGRVRWADSSRPLPEPYFRLAFLARRIAKRICGLPR